MHSSNVMYVVLAAAFSLLAPAATAQSFKLKAITAERPVASPTVPGAPTGAVYFTLHNAGKLGDILVSASTPRAKRVELHSMQMDGNVMKMREVNTIELAAGARLPLRPGGPYHLMLAGLGTPLKAGEKFPMTLRFRVAGRMEVTVVVEEPKPAAKPGEEAHHNH